MTTIKQDDLIESVADALQYISYYHPVDFILAINAAYEKEESGAAKDAMAQILINSRMCAEGHRPICQDTGIVTVFVKVGMDVQWDAELSLEDMIKIVKIVLKDSGYRILSQTDGQATLTYCAEENPDLVLMDLNMPGMDGFELTRKLREQGFTNPIVALTASEPDESRQKAVAAGCNDYVLKDMEMRGLETVIDSFIADSGGV